MDDSNNLEFHKELIDEILETDQIAQKKIDQQKQEEIENLKRVKFKKVQILKRLEKKSNDALEKLVSFKEKEFDEKVEISKIKNKNLIEKINNIFNLNRRRWVENIVKETLNFKN